VDTSAVLERSWAALAGLGWIGKNSLLIHPQLGSYVFIGSVLINQEVGRGPSPLPNYCGNCTRCLDGCPTKAFSQPGMLNSNQCISYWTLEKRGQLEINDPQKKALQNWVAGCDICQEVCPFNIKPVKAETNLGVPQNESSGAETVHSWREVLQESELSYKQRVKNSALSRIKPGQFLRNVALALKNAIQEGSFIEIEEAELRQLIQKKLESEIIQSDPYLRSLWEDLLQSAKRNP
jgi:epoxyqueuosine reductase